MLETKIKVKIFTLFPELFPGTLGSSIIGEALNQGIWQLEVINIRDFGLGKRKTVDDTVFGGGGGMLIRPDVLGDAIDFHIKNLQKTKIIYPSPRGDLFNQKKAALLSQEQELAIICGRYEGIDQRLIEQYDMEEISIGDYVISGGELSAMVILDAIIRNFKGVLGNEESLKEESFGNGLGSVFDNLLEYPQYTKPQVWQDKKVPEILLSGHHKNINQWRLQQAIQLTKHKRKDLCVKN